MTTKRASATLRRLESVSGGPLTFGALLESIRLGEEIGQATFAESLGISRSHLCDIEMGRKTVSPARAARFAEILGYSADQFVRLSLQDQVRNAGLRLTVRVEAAKPKTSNGNRATTPTTLARKTRRSIVTTQN